MLKLSTKVDRNPLDETVADSEQKKEDFFLSQHSSKPHVSSRASLSH